MSTEASLPAGALVADEGLAQHPDFAKLDAARRAPQDALRARLNAVVLDLLLLGLVSQLIATVAGSSKDTGGRALTFLSVEFAYFFVCELASGRTIGKRVFHVRVATSSGVPATARQIALRNVLRVVDALPLLYASGLISMIRTGPSRRQRIGDVVAGTTVLLDERGKVLRTPSWLLPTLALLAFAASLAVVIPALAKGREGPGPAPVEGVWHANATTISATGRDPFAASARWTIETQCPPAARCGLFLVLQPAAQPAVSARLIPARGGWVAVFPAVMVRCGEESTARTSYGLERSAIGLRFAAHGLLGEGEERDVWGSPRCGYSTARRQLIAGYVGVG